MSEFLVQSESLTAIAEAIRSKTGKEEGLLLSQMPDEIFNIETGVDTTDATATAADILQGKTAYANEEKLEGTIPTKTANDLSVNGAIVTVPAGYYEAQATKSVATAEVATPVISVSPNGKISANIEQGEGYVSGGVTSSVYLLDTQGAQTITPGTSNKTIASGKYLTGTQTIKGDANLIASNIASGKSIFGVTGTHQGTGFTVVGGTSQPTNPKENTIWVNTSNAITSYCFSSTKPAEAEGKVWFETGTNSPGDFNALEGNMIMVYPNHAEQYINGAWAPKEAYIYENSTWTQFAFTILWLYRNGDRNIGVTGDYYRDSPTSGKTISDGSTADGVKYLDLPNRGDESGLYKAYTIYTGKMIDITAFTTLKSKSKHGRSGDRIQVRNASLEVTAESASTKTSSDFQYPTLDVSALTGAYYISLYNFNNGYDNYDLYELYLE